MEQQQAKEVRRNTPLEPRSRQFFANGHRASSSGHALSMGSRPMRNSSATGKVSSTSGTHSNKRRPNQGNPSNRANTGPEMTDQPNNYDRAGSTQDTTALATAFVPLNLCTAFVPETVKDEQAQLEVKDNFLKNRDATKTSRTAALTPG